jgi:hypothetical protein
VPLLVTFTVDVAGREGTVNPAFAIDVEKTETPALIVTVATTGSVPFHPAAVIAVPRL